MASVILLFGKFKAPETYKLVEVRLVTTPLMITVLVAKKLVEVRLVATKVVKAPVDGVEAPIGVLLMVPPEIVRPSMTIASVMELVGKLMAPEAYKLVVETLTKMALVEVMAVPEALVKKSGPVNVPPANGK